MSTLRSLDVDSDAPAVITWQWNNSNCSLAEPDPQIKSITLTTRFTTTSAFFQLNIPIKLKGIKTLTSIILRISSSSIASFNFLPNADEALSPMRAQSGTVLDAIRQLANVTVLSVYVKAHEQSSAQLQSISDAINQDLIPSFRDDLSRMYTGTGAKIITLSVPAAHQSPPTYDEAKSPPPSAPIFDRKRPRKDFRDSRDEDLALIWARLGDDAERLNALEQENGALREEAREVRKQFQKIETCLQDLREDIDALESRLRRGGLNWETSWMPTLKG
ncbi:hypothetical protein N0V84_007238 [Fusarium piperis]|uniref:Uncharacterized protein n=1 Tax=Fusarium piperis TaxID=1435070 RepID=A0A9W8WAD0_9HYPO|nr:hypothetical protein N0V84_007238 [Fusarium piperis]